MYLPLSIIDLDQKALLALNFDGGNALDSIMWLASDKLVWLPLYAVMIWLLWRRFGWRQTLLIVGLCVVAVALADQISGVFKHYTPKFRPTHTPAIQNDVHTVNGYRGGLYGTVSAHAATLSAVAVITASLLRRWWWTVICVLWVLTVCYSRIYLGVHFPLDILFGCLLGVILGWISVVVFRKFVKRYPDAFRAK